MVETIPANPDRPVLEARGLTKTYQDGENTLTVLDHVDLQVMPAETCAIIGPSGSGKTTLLGLCAGLDDATSGTVCLDGQSLENLTQNARAALRGKSIGFVFQNFQLIPTLTALENVLIPLELQGQTLGRATAQALLERVGLGKRLTHYPHQLSGGEQQRVALARAFVRPPKILFADEPTGNLDSETSALLIDILFELNRENGTALILVTHDPSLAARADRIVRMQSGRILPEHRGPQDSPARP
jgi:putative ABC transport system ATP-binding protein